MKLRFNAQILFTGLMLVAFFLPWFSMGIFEFSGYNLPSRMAAINSMGSGSGNGLGYLNLVYVIPVLALAILALNLANKSTRIVALLLSLIPLAAVAYSSLFGATSFFEVFSIGAYLTLIGALLLLLSAIGIIRFGEETDSGANILSLLRTHGKKIAIGATGLALAIGLFIGGRALWRKINAPPVALAPKTFDASSTLPRSANYSHDASRAFDGYRSTAWGEGVKGDGIGESLTATFAEPVKIKSIGIVNGFAEMHATLGNLYKLNNRVKKAKLIFDDGEETLTFADDRESEQSLKLDSAHMTKSVKFVILEVYKGAKWDDTLVSELAFYGP